MVLIPKMCPECGSTNFVIDIKADETICSNCGLVIEQSKSLKEKVIFT